jgi:uncharacterized protein (TIGR01619 family)
MTDHWDSYFCKVNGELASILVDLGLADQAPISAYSIVLVVSLHLKNPRSDGLSDSSEFETLRSIEDSLTKSLSSSNNAVSVGRITSAGRREFYFYAPSLNGFEAVVTDLMARFPGYEYECSNHDDTSWKQYFDVLYPSPAEYQRMSNRRVIENLQLHGDPLTKPRPVDHWIYFRNEASRNLYVNHIKSKGFVVVDQSTQDGERPHSLHITRVDNVDPESIDSVVLDLLELAIKMDADYDGWETSIEKE